MRFCGECGTKIEDDQQEFCHECGNKLELDNDLKNEDKNDADNSIVGKNNSDVNIIKSSDGKPGTLMYVVIALALVLLVVVIALLILIIKTKNDNQVSSDETVEVTEEISGDAKSSEITDITEDAETTETTETESDISDSQWKEAYLNYVSSIYDVREYQLVYIDDNDIPELVIYYNTEAGGTEICSYGSTGLFNKIILGGTGGFDFYDKAGVIINISGRQGVYREDIYILNDGLFTNVINGSYVQSYSTGEMEDYDLNGQAVTPEEYKDKVNSFLSNESAIRVNSIEKYPLYNYDNLIKELTIDTSITNENNQGESTLPDEIVVGKSINSNVIIPQINYDSSVASQFNSEMNSMFSLDNLSEYQVVTYDWYMADGYLSIIISISYQTDDVFHEIYRININDDVMMTSKDVLDYYEITEDEFYAAAQTTLCNECNNLYGTIDSSIYNDLYNNTYSMENVKLSIPYVGENGKLYICGIIYCPAGQLYNTHLLNVPEELY